LICLPAWQLSACQSSCLCSCPCRMLCIISTRGKGDVVSSAILRPQTLQEVMSGSRLTPWTEDAPRQSCSGLALATWKISGSKKILLEAGSLTGYSHGDAPRFLVSSGGAENFYGDKWAAVSQWRRRMWTRGKVLVLLHKSLALLFNLNGIWMRVSGCTLCTPHSLPTHLFDRPCSQVHDHISPYATHTKNSHSYRFISYLFTSLLILLSLPVAPVPET